MLGAVRDRVRVALGRPTEWERRTQLAVLETYDIISGSRARAELLEPSAYRHEPAVVHKPTGWLTVFPMKPSDRRLRWLRTEEGQVTMEAGVLRSSVWLQTFIGDPNGVSLADEFDQRVAAAERAGEPIAMLVRNPPSADGDTPGELSLTFLRNGAPQALRLLMLGVKGHVVEVAYDTPARLAQTAARIAYEAFAIGLENVRHPPGADWPDVDPDEPETMREFGMSEEEIAQAVKEEAGRPLFDRP